ncbi:MAG: CRISPR-associated endonuclease Cas1 [Thermodesulfobacteriota bacterium]
MDTVYVLEPGSYLRRDGTLLKVVKDGNTIDEIPADGLKRLILVGYVSLSGGVLDFLIGQRIETVFITPTGRYRARLAIDEHRHVGLRTAQYLKLSNEPFALKTAMAVVIGKIENMHRLMLLRARQYQEAELRTAAAKLTALKANALKAGRLDILRGFEGAATRIYYSSFGRLIRNDAFAFNGRNKRPPLDPVNAMLSFVYTLLTNEVLSAIKVAGLDPYLGSLHEISYGRPSLACDLVEEYRCFLGDRLVLGLINRKAVNPDDFICRRGFPAEFTDEDEMKSRRPVEMKPAISRAFISAYEQMMSRRIIYEPLGKEVEYRWLILNQVRRFAQHLENPDQPYQPFLWDN